MTNTYNSNRTLIICLIIALILHLLVSLTLFIKFQAKNSDQTKPEELTRLKELLDPKKEVSSLKPSPFAAPVVFYDEDDEEAPQEPTKEVKPQIEAKVKSKVETNIQKTVKNIEKKSKEIQKKIKEKIKKSDPKSEKLVIETMPNLETVEISEPEIKAEEINIEEFVPQIETKPLSAAEKLIESRRKTSVEAASQLAKITQGFVNYMKEEGNNQFLERQGNGKFDPHEAKLISYYNKIISFFHKAARMNNSTFNDIVSRFVNMNPSVRRIEVGLKLIIKKDGRLEDVIVVYRSGYDDYDRHIIRTFENAAPFPPVPDHISKDELAFPIAIYTPLERPIFSLNIG